MVKATKGRKGLPLAWGRGSGKLLAGKSEFLILSICGVGSMLMEAGRKATVRGKGAGGGFLDR